MKKNKNISTSVYCTYRKKSVKILSGYRIILYTSLAEHIKKLFNWYIVMKTKK